MLGIGRVAFGVFLRPLGLPERLACLVRLVVVPDVPAVVVSRDDGDVAGRRRIGQQRVDVVLAVGTGGGLGRHELHGRVLLGEQRSHGLADEGRQFLGRPLDAVPAWRRSRARWRATAPSDEPAGWQPPADRRIAPGSSRSPGSAPAAACWTRSPSRRPSAASRSCCWSSSRSAAGSRPPPRPGRRARPPAAPSSAPAPSEPGSRPSPARRRSPCPPAAQSWCAAAKARSPSWHRTAGPPARP